MRFRAVGKLTKADIESLIAEGKPIAGKSDGNGLTFTMSAAQAARGEATWTLRFSANGKQRERTLGNYPVMSVETARKAAEVGYGPMALARSTKRFSRLAELRYEVARISDECIYLAAALVTSEARLDAARVALKIEEVHHGEAD
jgi:hypothetical protein